MFDKHPAGWLSAQVQQVISKSFCGHSPTCEERPIATTQEWGILKTTAITWNGWNENAHKVPPAKFWGNENIEIKEGDVLVTKAGPRHRVGVVTHVQTTIPHLMVSGKMIGLRPIQDIVLPRILSGSLSLLEPQVFLDHRSTGMAESQVNFNNEVLLATPIVLPSMPEQKVIVEILDTMDEAIRKTEAVLAKLLQVKAGMLHDLLTRGLDENGELRDSLRHPEQFIKTPFGIIPKKWELSPLGKLAEISSGITLGNSPFGTGTIELPYLRVANVQDGYLDLQEIKKIRIYKKDIDRFVLKKGDVLMNEGGDYDKLGRGAVWEGELEPCLHQNHVFKVRPFPESLNPYFLNAVSSSHYGKKYFLLSSKQSTNLASINSTQLKEFPIPCPALSEQGAIVESIAAFERRFAQEEAELIKLKTVKQGLLHDLLTGRVRVPDHFQEALA